MLRISWWAWDLRGMSRRPPNRWCAQFALMLCPVLLGAPADLSGGERVLADAPRAKGCDSKVQGIVDRGNAVLDGGNYLEAEKAFNSALSLQPDCFDAHVGLADLLMHEKEDAENGHKHAKEA